MDNSAGLVKDTQYFDEYENLEIHELMLNDRPRQEAYAKAIHCNKDLFNDKIVLDVGAGTGILSVMAAKAGAKLVYAVEATELVNIAQELVDENGCGGVVKVVKSKIEDFQLPSEVDKVDIIISEWMGFYLLHEGMLDSVIFARDKFLRTGGIMFPEFGSIHVAPCSIPSLFNYWRNVDGVKMTKFSERLRMLKSTKPLIMTVPADDLLHDGVLINWIDLCDVTSADLDEIRFQEVVAIQKPGNYQGFCIWFDCKFPGVDISDSDIILSTSPKSPATHWKQCVIVLPENACEEVRHGDPIAFELIMSRKSDDKRRYNLEINLLDQEKIDHPLPCDCIFTKCILAKAYLASLEENVELCDQ